MRKKILILLYLALVCVVLANAGSSTVWSGSFDPNSWGSWQDIPLDSVKSGDKVVFHGEAYDNAQIQINSSDWATKFTGDYASFDGTYTLDVNDNNVDILRKGVHVKGQNFKLTSVAVVFSNSDDKVSYESLPWSGSFDPQSWNAALALKAPNAKVGDVLVFSASTGSNAQVQFAKSDFSSYIMFNGNKYDSFRNGYELTVTSDNLSLLQNGFVVKGQNFTLTEVQLKSNGNKDDGGDTGDTGSYQSLPWQGSFNPSNWNNALALKASGLKEGQQIVFHGDAGNNAQIQLGDGALKNFYDFDGKNYTDFEDGFSVEITADNKAFFENGFKVKGRDYTLTSVTVSDGNNTGGDTGGNTGGDTGGGSNLPTGDGFHTSGTKLLDANGNEFIMRGVNYSWCWQYGNGDGNTADDVIPAAKRIGANVIRIQLADGGNHSWKKPTAAELSSLIKLCEDNKLVAIFNTHDETGSNKVDDLVRAANFWISMKDLLNAHRSTVLINISNEWYGAWEAEPWAAGYQKVIPMMRNAGIKNTLVVDCAGYGQYPASIPAAGAKVLAADKDKNLIFSEHLYDCFPTANKVDAAIDNALTVGAPVIVGEFSYNHKGQSVAWQEILDHCQAKGIGYLGWSWTGNGDGTEACDMFGGYDDSNMKENGKCIILGRNGIKETSKECSVFSGIHQGGSTGDDANYLPWTGSATAGDGKLFSAAGFTVGDTIQFVGSGSGKITVATKDGKEIASGSFNGDYRLAVTDDNFSALTGTFKLLGSGYTITAINKKRYVKGGDTPVVPVENGYRLTIWEGSFPIEWSGNGLKLLGYRFEGAKAGDKLIFTISDPVYSGEKGPQLQIGNSGYSAMVEGKEGQGCVDIKKGATTYSLVLNAENADDLINGQQDGGLRIKGQNCTLTSVVLETATPQYEYTKTVIFTPKGGSLDMGMWSDDALTKIDKMKFVNANLQEGDRVVFNLTETKETEIAQLQIATLSPSWEALRPEFKNIGVQTPRFWFTVTAEEAQALRTKSMGIKGTKCILKSIEVWHRNGSITGIESIKAETEKQMFDATKPYEVYSLSGQRLNGFEDGHRQVYIVRQNGKAYKIIR